MMPHADAADMQRNGGTMTYKLACAVVAALTLSATGGLVPSVAAAEGDAEPPAAATPQVRGISTGWVEGDQDVPNELKAIDGFGQRRKGVIGVSPIQPLRDAMTAFNDLIYGAINMRLGVSFHTLGQFTTDHISGTPDAGGASDLDVVGTWEIFNRGTPTQGEIFFGVEGRWDYGNIGPQTLGFVSVGTAGGTGNTFSRYDPAFILRNIYYRMGGPEAGWTFRLGKITTDAMLLTNRHISPNATFLSNASTGVFAAGFADSGLGATAAYYFGDQGYIAGVIADANGDRFTFGDISEGDFYKGIELGWKIRPRTDKASYSKLLFWQTDGTSDGSPINANTGRNGWGIATVISQELSADGNTVFVGRYGHSFNRAAIFDNQLGLSFLQYQPFAERSFDDDVIGATFNWIDSSTRGTRQEYSVEAFYRFPFLPDVDTTLAYQAVIDPAATREFDSAHVFSLRITTAF